MINVESICKSISNSIANELNLDSENKSVVNYGIFAFVQTFLSIIAVIIFGFIFKVAIESLIISLIVALLRKNSGGVHASSPNKCIVIGTISSVLLAIIAKNLRLNLFIISVIGFFVFAFSYNLVYKLAPVDSINKPIKKKEKRIKLRKKSIILINVYLIIVIINLISYVFNPKYTLLVYSMCIYMGLVWQVFSLTKIGHIVLSKFDSLL